MKKVFLCLVIAVSLGVLAVADEGMWPYNAVPKTKIKTKYGVDLTQAWLDHLQLSSVKFPGGSGSFVSPNGLIFTNHHIGRGCTHAVSTPEHDFMKDGFYAKTREAEPKCPGLEVMTLQEIKDVTKEVEASAKAGMSDAEVGAAQRAEIMKLEKDCTDAEHNIRCQMVTLYSGGMYHLYKYKVYNDVRLVMAPEYDIAFFGGDPDNFTYPRYDLDITFLRAYENDKPAIVKDYLKFSNRPVKENDLIFVSGHPGSTGRLQTMAQLEYLRDVAYPFRLKTLETQIKAYFEFADKSADNKRVAENLIFGAQNSFKAFTGYQSGLLDKEVMATKAADEKALRDAVMKDPEMAKEFGGAWDAIAKAMQWQRDNFNRITFMGDNGVPGRLAMSARALVRLTSGGAEDRAMQGPMRLEQFIDSTQAVDSGMEEVQLRLAFQFMLDKMGAEDPFVQTVLAGKSPAERAAELVSGTKLGDIAYRKELLAGGKDAVEASSDPMLVLIRKIDADARAVRKDVEDNVNSVVRRNGAYIAKARFKLYGTEIPPDATNTLRLSYGPTRSYVSNGKKINYFTTLGDAFDYASQHGDKDPYKLPDSWMKAKSKLNLKTQYDSVNTTDIIGGNSGSPAVNKKGEVVGIIFDGNIESLPWNFQYEDKVGRSVITNSSAVIEVLQKVYNAPELADELMNSPKK
ncbi:MAG TPA: S46 family peptidase [Terriglobales bacterium]|nr:S46 family peptidase [Terriglobales bacterium]